VFDDLKAQGFNVRVMRDRQWLELTPRVHVHRLRSLPVGGDETLIELRDRNLRRGPNRRCPWSDDPFTTSVPPARFDA